MLCIEPCGKSAVPARQNPLSNCNCDCFKNRSDLFVGTCSRTCRCPRHDVRPPDSGEDFATRQTRVDERMCTTQRGQKREYPHQRHKEHPCPRAEHASGRITRQRPHSLFSLCGPTCAKLRASRDFAGITRQRFQSLSSLQTFDALRLCRVVSGLGPFQKDVCSI